MSRGKLALSLAMAGLLGVSHPERQRGGRKRVEPSGLPYVHGKGSSVDEKGNWIPSQRFKKRMKRWSKAHPSDRSRVANGLRFLDNVIVRNRKREKSFTGNQGK